MKTTTTKKYVMTQDNWILISAIQLHACLCVRSLQLCLSLCDPMDSSLPGSSAHGILQARILEWVAIPFSRGLS